jgi:hypothetical protein
MQNNRDIKPINEEGEPHGYWEVYFPYTHLNTLNYSGHYINGDFWCKGFYYVNYGTEIEMEYYAK